MIDTIDPLHVNLLDESFTFWLVVDFVELGSDLRLILQQTAREQALLERCQRLTASGCRNVAWGASPDRNVARLGFADPSNDFTFVGMSPSKDRTPFPSDRLQPAMYSRNLPRSRSPLQILVEGKTLDELRRIPVPPVAVAGRITNSPP